MNDLLNLIQREIDRALTARHHERVGLVTSYDPTAHAAKVLLQPEGFETGWLPIHGHHVGNGWGMVVGLQIHDQVRVSFQEGDLETGAITARIHSDDDKPPHVESGEILIKHQSGALVKLDKDGNLTTTGPSGNVTTHDKDGAITHQGKGGSTVTIDPKGVAGVTTKSPKNVVNRGEKVIHTGGPAKTGSAQDEALKSQIKAKAQADLAADPARQSVNMQTTLPSGAAYSYTVTRS